MNSQPPSLVCQAAILMLDRKGISAIWELELSAAKLDAAGNAKAAAVISAVADAAAELWARRNLAAVDISTRSTPS